MAQAIKGFLKPTKAKIIATFIVIVVLMSVQALAVQSWPRETLFSQIYSIVFTPVDFIRKAILSIIGADLHPPLAGPVTFTLDILTYYVLGCLVVYVVNSYKNQKIIRS